MADVKKEQWLKVGLHTLDNKGAEHLKIAEMCKQLNVTKGAFYHWFGSKKDYDRALLEYWQDIFTEEFIRQSESAETAKKKLSRLVEQCIDGISKGSRLEIEINMWAKQNSVVGEFVTGVYTQRFDYLMGLLNDIYADPQQAKRHGLTLYCLLVGCDLFFRSLSKSEAQLMFAEYLA